MGRPAVCGLHCDTHSVRLGGVGMSALVERSAGAQKILSDVQGKNTAEVREAQMACAAPCFCLHPSPGKGGISLLGSSWALRGERGHISQRVTRPLRK
jgi:hypothetical protein